MSSLPFFPLALVLAQAPELTPLPLEAVPDLVWKSEAFAIHSEVLEEDVRLFVAWPPSFDTARRDYPLLLLLDGQYYFPEVAPVLANLVANGQVPELVLVGVESRDRRRDFTPTEIVLPDVGDGGRLDAYLDFLEHELVPALAPRRCGVPRVLLGHSHAGIVVLHALATRPSAFPLGVELDAPVHLEDGFLARELVETLGRSERPPVRLASLGCRFSWSDAAWAELEAAARPGDLLWRRGMPAESHETMVFAGSYQGLQALFVDASIVRARGLSALEIDQRFRALSASLGADLPPPEALMRRVVDELLLEGYGARAGEWLARCEATYGRSSDHEALARRVEEVTALGEPEETVAEMLARPFASPEEMRAHLGVWKGKNTTEGYRSESLAVRFWVEDGAVRGVVEHEHGPAMAIEYLVVRPDGGLDFGYRNGMAPRGLLVFSEETPGGLLEGPFGFRGIRFSPPEGFVPPARRWELTKMP